MPANLTSNAIIAVNNGDLNLKPLLQVLEIKRISNSQERYKFLLSDGTNLQQALLSTQLNDYVKSGRLQKGTVVQLIDYICNTVQNRKIIVVLNMEIIVPNCEIIGDPQSFTYSKNDLAASQRNFVQSVSMPQNTSYDDKLGFTKVESVTGMSGSVSSARIYSNSRNNSQNSALNRGVVQPSYQPPPVYNNRGPITKNEAPARIIPITALNPYQGRWAIKGRVTAKGDLRRYNNAKGDGKVFHFDLIDSDGGEIRVTCFNSVVDRFCDLIEVGRVYLISKGSLKPAQKNFNHLNNEWEVFLESSSTVELCHEEDESIPRQQFSFKPINEIVNMENNSVVDVIGIVISVNPSVTILRKNGMETQRRIIFVKDASGRSVELTLWGNFCNKEGRELQDMCDSGFFPVLAVKAGKINDFSGKSIGTISATQLFINPDSSEAHFLREWFDREGKNIASQSISRDFMPVGHNEIRKTVSQIRDEGLGRADKPDWITVKATVSFIKSDNFCYTACPLMIGDRQCSKKVVKSSNGRWHCERCDRDFPECDYRYLLQAQVHDHTGVSWITAFQESGEEILGCSAKELYLLREQDETRFGEIVRASLFDQYLFKLRIKEEIYGDEQRVKITVVKAEKLDFPSESKYLIESIAKLSMRS